jgi:hypothetical protein
LQEVRVLRRLVVVSSLAFSPSLFAQTHVAPTATSPHDAHPALAAASRDNSELPVRRVVLYKNGVGYFEHEGRVTGNQAVTIDFTSPQLDDALQSLTALDLNGGRISTVDWNSTTPLNQQLKNIPLGLGENPSTKDLYAALQGAQVEVSGAGEAPVSGRIVHYEIRSEKTAAGGTANHRVLTVASSDGAIRSLEVTPATSVRILDGGLRSDLDGYLALLASAQSRQMRHLTLSADGSGARTIRVSYISEVPVWKSTYRIVFPPEVESNAGAAASTSPVRPAPDSAILQGWAVVDNTVGSDWDNVQLSLVAGAPQSFTEPLSQPIYTTRPKVAVPEAANVAPEIHEGAVGQAADAVTMNGEQAMPQSGKAAPGGYGSGTGGGVLHLGGGAGGGRIAAPPPPPLASAAETVVVNAETAQLQTESATVQSEISAATTSSFDDFFEYSVAEPVTLHKNQSALVPFLQTNVDAERVTLWNADDAVPLRALWLTNSSSLTLDRGSFSVFENGEFAGEGLTDPIHAGEKRLLSYAVDQAVHVSTEGEDDTTHLHHIAVRDGILTERSEQLREVTYVVHNAAPDARTVILEHPVDDGWKLTSDPQPVETTPDNYRFRVVAGAGETTRLHVGETHTDFTRWQLVDLDNTQLHVILAGDDNLPAMQQALAPILDARAKLHALDAQMAAKQKDIDRVEADSTRLHTNIQGLKDSEEERALARRYAGELDTGEDQLQSLRKDRADLEQQRQAAQQALDDAIRKLSIDLDV